MINYSKEFTELFVDIEVSESDYEKAEKRYQSIAEYISSSELKKYNPDIFIQGSFKLGTAIKPLTDDGSYDIDIVCNFLDLRKSMLTQKELKEKVGKIINEYAKKNNMKTLPKDGRRCWTLNYVDNRNFHVDILPTVPNGLMEELALTDKQNSNYDIISNEWEISNPLAYCEWFNKLSKYKEYRMEYAKQAFASVEDIPYYKVKTPLQRIVQILKRHAEVMFEEEIEYKPSSIVITTLAAKSYSKYVFEYNDFDTILNEVLKNIENEIDYVDGKYCVMNPVDPNENLSSKWIDDDLYYEEFKNWINRVKYDFSIDYSIDDQKEKYNLIRRSLNKYNTPILITESLNYLPHHERPKWYMNPWKDVEIVATAYQNKFRSKVLESNHPIGKNITIKFKVKADMLYMYEIYWQITNTGLEARRYDQLRGDFYNSEIIEGTRVRQETTKYIGKHYVEAYLVKDNVCVGKSDPFVVNVVSSKKFIF